MGDCIFEGVVLGLMGSILVWIGLITAAFWQVSPLGAMFVMTYFAIWVGHWKWREGD